MKKLLLLTLLVPLLLTAQKNQFEKIKGLNAYVQYPAHKGSKAMVFLVGRNQQGSDPNAVFAWGPAKFAKQGKSFPDSLLIITLQFPYYELPDYVNVYVDSIKVRYGITELCATGLSAGAQNWQKYINYSKTSSTKLSAAVIVSMEDASDSKNADGSIGYRPEYVTYPYWGICGTNDSFYEKQKAYTSKISGSIWTDFPGAGHSGSVWDKVYDPEWKSPNTGGSIYEWFLGKKTTTPDPEVPIPNIKNLKKTIYFYADGTYLEVLAPVVIGK